MKYFQRESDKVWMASLSGHPDGTERPLKDGPVLRGLLEAEHKMKVCGFFIEYAVEQPDGTFKTVGTKAAEYEPGRGFGSLGQREGTWVFPQVVKRGHKEALIKASTARPVYWRSMLQITCGRRVNPTICPKCGHGSYLKHQHVCY